MLSLHYVIPKKILSFVMPRQARNVDWTATTRMRAFSGAPVLKHLWPELVSDLTETWSDRASLVRKQNALSQVSFAGNLHKHLGWCTAEV